MMGGLLLSLKNEIVKVAPRGRINCVAPGWVRTPMADRAMADGNLLYQALASYGRPAHLPPVTVLCSCHAVAWYGPLPCRSPLKKVSEPEDVARAILFLSSERAAGNITGHVIDCNAGMEGRLLNKREDFAM